MARPNRGCDVVQRPLEGEVDLLSQSLHCGGILGGGQRVAEWANAGHFGNT
jgi:hypothetical protein